MDLLIVEREDDTDALRRASQHRVFRLKGPHILENVALGDAELGAWPVAYSEYILDGAGTFLDVHLKAAFRPDAGDILSDLDIGARSPAGYDVHVIFLRPANFGRQEQCKTETESQGPNHGPFPSCCFHQQSPSPRISAAAV